MSDILSAVFAIGILVTLGLLIRYIYVNVYCNLIKKDTEEPYE